MRGSLYGASGWVPLMGSTLSTPLKKKKKGDETLGSLKGKGRKGEVKNLLHRRVFAASRGKPVGERQGMEEEEDFLTQVSC